MENLILVHTGRGGRFNNAGYKTCKGIVSAFNPDYFGINIYFDNDDDPTMVLDSNGNEKCSYEEFNSSKGTFEIDGDYDTYNWFPISEADEEDIRLLVKDLSAYEYQDALIEAGVDANVFNILSELNKLEEYASDITPDNPTSFEDFIQYSEVLEFDEENEDYDCVEINGKFYTID